MPEEPYENINFGLRRSLELIEEDPKVAKEAFKAAAAAHCPHCGVKHRTLTPDECADRRMSEKTLQSRVMDRAKRRGWDVKHVPKGIAAFDAAGKPIFVSGMKGFPDLFMLHEGMKRALAIECKKQQGEYEPGQAEYLALLNACGIPAVTVRPSDLRTGRVNAILGAL